MKEFKINSARELELQSEVIVLALPQREATHKGAFT